MTYAVEQRLRMVDFLLAHYGTVNRAALCDFFGISVPQASLDFRAYLDLAPLNMRYDAQAKTYRRGERFVRQYP